MRSGHHAIANWLFEQCEGNTVFINRILGRVSHYESFRSTFPTWKPDAFIYNFEDETPQQALEMWSQYQSIFDLGKDKIVDVLILRDPYNLFASRVKMEDIILKAGKTNTSPVGAFTEAAFHTWKIFAFEFLRQTSNLNNPVCINYNKWVTSIEYREEIANALGIDFTDEGVNIVPAFGGGSSFDSQDYQNRALDMQVNERYLNYINFRWFRKLFDKETEQLSKAIFGTKPFHKCNNFHKLFL